MTKTPLFPITIFVSILIFFLVSGCGNSGSTPTNQPPTLISIAVSPAVRSIPLGGTQKFKATGYYSDGSTSDLTNSVTWSSSDMTDAPITAAGVLSVSSGAAAVGKQLTISASSSGITVSIVLTVTQNITFTNWTTPGNPVGVAVDATGNVYIANAAFSDNSSTINVYNAPGKQTASFNVSITSNVAGAAVDASGNIYVTDYINNQLNKYSSTGTLMKTWPSPSPSGVAVDSSGNIYVTGAANNNIYKYDSSGTLITSWSTTGVPTGVAVDSSGNVYVADFSERMIWKYASDGTYKMKWTTTGTPSGVAVDPTGTKVYVADTYYYMLREYDSNGNPSQNGPWSTIGWPNAVAVDSSGNVYVVDATNNKVRVCSPQ